MSRVGFVGVGRMGAPMVARLVEAGHEVFALARTSEKSAAIKELGAQPVSTIADVGTEAELIVVCVFADEQVKSVCLESNLLEVMKPGSVLVVHTTGSPETSVTIAARADRHFIDVVDAPVSGGPHDVAAGQVSLFVGGGDEAVAQVSPVLSSYADPILHVGPTGAGQRVKLVNNALFAAQIGVVAEGIRLGQRLGIDESTLLTALPYGSATSRALSGIASAGSAATFIAAVGDFVGKDVGVIRRTLGELGSDMGILAGIVDAGLQPSVAAPERRSQ